jgi:apolipoprotein N-acyltransferase
MPFIYGGEGKTGEWIKGLAAQIHCNLLFGAVSRDKNGRLYNSAYVVGKDGGVLGIYHKVHLVPFGEYTPLAEYIPFLEGLTAEGIGFHPGQGHHPIVTAVGRIGILICYEGIFPEIARQTVKSGAQVLVNITNDAWYDRSSAPYQHFVSYIFRAVETDRYILRAANTGISGIIDPRGRIKATTRIFEDAVLNGGFSLKEGKTFYVRYGDYFLLVIILAFGLLFF